MNTNDYYTLHITGTTPDQMTADRLARYLLEMANLLGDKEKVRFHGVEEGSAMLIVTPDNDVAERVR